MLTESKDPAAYWRKLKQLLRIIRSIPSPKAEPFTLLLAEVGRERIEETIDPEQAIDRAFETYPKKDTVMNGFIKGFFLSVSEMPLLMK